MSTSHPEAIGRGALPVPPAGSQRPTPPARQGPQRPELTDAAVVSRSWGMATATLISRITGFARIVLLAAILGAALTSAFSVANQLPNQIAALVLEATFTAIFVPVLARAERDDADGGEAFVRRLVTLATAVLLVATVVSLSATPVLVRLMLGGDPQVNEALTRAFAFLLIPQVLFYGLSSVFMAILNNRNIFGPPAWAPVINNLVVIVTLVVYVLVPGELSVDPVRMGNTKLLVLGIGTTLGVVAQAAVLFVAIRRQRIILRPLWGIDDRLKKFGAMAAAMVLYVLISQVGFVVTNQIAATAAASGPGIYNYTWLLLQLPFGIIGVTVLTVVTPRLSRHAAAADTAAVLGDISLATRLTMITLIPVAALMTLGGPAIGSALFAYGNFGATDAGYLGAAVALSAFTLIPYQLVLLQLRVFYARQEPWTPILIVIVITAVKIIASVLAPHLTDVPDLVAGYLGTANGLGFAAGAVAGHYLLRHSLAPPSGRLVRPDVVQTVLITVTASLLAALAAMVLDRVFGLPGLIAFGGAGALLRLLLLGAVMIPIMIAVLLWAHVPEAQAGLATVRRHLPARGRSAAAPVSALPRPADNRRKDALHTESYPGRADPAAAAGPILYTGASDGRAPASPWPAQDAAGDRKSKGLAVPDEPRPTLGAVSEPIPAGPASPISRIAERLPQGVELKSDVMVVDGRYRLLIFHGGSPTLQFWQALDTAVHRHVALTFIDPDLTMPEPKRSAILDRTRRLQQIHLVGLATILDVITSPTAGLVVSEWVRGASLPEVAGTSPSPVGAARATRALAAAAAAAHHAGIGLSVDHPGRIRISVAGDATLAFPAAMPGARPAEDIRGIGACLYALLVNRWPLAESAAHSGLRSADRDTAGQPINPELIDRSIPFPIAASAMHAIGQSGGIRTASTLVNLLQQISPTTDRTEQLLAVEDSFTPSAQSASGRRKAVLMVVGLAVAVAILGSGVKALSSLLDQVFGNVGPLQTEELGVNNPSALSSASPASAGRGITPAGVTVFSPDGGPDHPDDAVLAIDGDHATAWSTDAYQDRQPFPNFKSGVGLMLKLPAPTEVASVTVDLSSNGTRVEIRSAKNPYPASLHDTELLAAPKALHPGGNRITVDGAGHPTSYLLIWIVKLGTTGSESRSAISEISITAMN